MRSLKIYYFLTIYHGTLSINKFLSKSFFSADLVFCFMDLHDLLSNSILCIGFPFICYYV